MRLLTRSRDPAHGLLELAGPILAALSQDPLVRVEGGDFSPGELDRWKPLITSIGVPADEGEDGATGQKDGSTWVDVRYDPTRSHTFRHSATAQPLHTDGAYLRQAVDLVFFLCQDQATQGGETIFVGADTVEREVQAADPALHQHLWQTPLTYGKGDRRGRCVPVFSRDHDGVRINWNYYRVLDSTANAAAVREGFFAFLRDEIVARGKVDAVLLRPGDALIFADQKVLHGRHAFTPSPRCMWKCNVNRSPATS